jgi:prolipoprotein diacylglyceryl transferase
MSGSLSRVTFASIPSPGTSVWHLWVIPIRAYALCIILGIVAAAWITDRRMRARGAPPWAILDVVVWAVPLGIIGARIYSVITTPQPYFGRGGHLVDVFKIWQGGLGIWGAVAGGALGAWIACKRMGIPLSFVADCMAPALPVAQAIGRFGNYFNNELYGRATSLPWGLQIHKTMVDGVAVGGPDTTLYQPTFLYEVIWDLGVALLVWLLDRRYRFGRGRAFALYVMAYTAGRAWIEYLRIDTANHILGLRLNDWTSIIVFIGALIYFVKVRGPRVDLTPATTDEDGTHDDIDTGDEGADGDDAAADTPDSGEDDVPRPVDAEAGDDRDDGAGEPAGTEPSGPAKTKR